MVDAGTTKRALADLAADPSSAVARAVIDVAATAVSDVEFAAVFERTVGVERLRAAIAAARESNERELARRGERALAAFERFREAAR